MADPEPAWDVAPGWPGLEARWTSSAKCGVGTSAGPGARVWFTVSHGILNEVYYPRVDQACTRDLGCLITGPDGFLSEEKRHARHAIASLADGVPAFRLTNTCLQGRYRVEKEILSDPRRDVVLQRVRFTALQGALGDYGLFALLAPHLGNHGDGNTAWVEDFKGRPLLLAQRGALALALASSVGWRARSVGFVGASDGWQDLALHGRLEWRYTRAEDGNVGLTGEVDLQACDGLFTLALGFGTSPAEAAHRAVASLEDGFERAAAEYAAEWLAWQRTLRPQAPPEAGARDLYRVSTAVLRTHESTRFPGGIIASLSIPWGATRGDGELGGYHLVWPRDLVESAGGLLAAGALGDARRVLRYLSVVQEADGHWPQNMWLDGTPYWPGVQMDETGFPILLVDLAFRTGALSEAGRAHLWPMVRRAAGYLCRNGPVTPQDRWEEDPGYSPFTLAVEVAALLCAAELADAYEPALGGYLRETADAWNAALERWTYVTDTELAQQVGVDGYYVRIAPADGAAAGGEAMVLIKNALPGEGQERSSHLISPDALALVRFGLRAVDDPRVLNTLQVIDALLRVELPAGPVWRRYNGDRYGEHDDGAAFDGTGTGRPWPLLTAERAHYELAAGRPAQAARLQATLARLAGAGGLLPEQVWDAPDVPERELFRGGPSGSAMPLVWAHAEYVKLCRSLADGRVFDTPPQTVQRYQVERQGSVHCGWRFNHRCRALPQGQRLRVEVLAPALIHWSSDGWQTVHDAPTRDTGLGLHVVDLPTERLEEGVRVTWSFYWPQAQRWEGRDFTLTVTAARAPQQGVPP